jgi:hypothetical protein
MRAGESLEEGNSADQLDLRTARRHAGISPAHALLDQKTHAEDGRIRFSPIRTG